MRRLIEQTACEHGKWGECDTLLRVSGTPHVTKPCPGGSSREITVDKTFTVKHNPIPIEGPYGEPQEDYPIVEQGIFETTHTTLHPGEYAVIAWGGR